MKKILAIVLLAAALGYLSFIYVHHSPSKASEVAQKSLSNENPDQFHKGSSAGAANPLKNASDVTDKQRAEISRRLLEAGKKLNRTGDFFGQIVDAKTGNPSEGVTVSCETSTYTEKDEASFLPKSGLIEAITDRDGVFAFREVHGLSMHITPRPQAGEEISPVSVAVDLRETGGPRRADLMSSSEKPYIFKLLKIADKIKLTGGALAFYRCEPTDKKYGIFLIEKRVEPGASGDLNIAFKRMPGEMTHNDMKWSVAISAGRATLQESDDSLMYEAPDNGYQTLWERQYTPGDVGYGRQKQAKFYLKFDDGRFAKVVVDFTADQREFCGFNVHYWISPVNSRILK